MTHLVILTTLDVEGRRNNREHHAIAAYRRRFDRVTVVFRRRGQGGVGRFLGSDVAVSVRDGVTYVAVDPPLSPREGTVRALAGEGGTPGALRRWLGTALDTAAVARDAATIRALNRAASTQLPRGGDAVCEAFGPWAAEAAIALRRQGRVRAVAYVDRDFEPGFTTSPLRRRWAAMMEGRAAARADLTLSISPRLADRLRAAAGSRLHLSPTGVDRDRFVPRRRSEPAARLVFVGLVAPWSGIEEALGALARLHRDRDEAHLTVVGPAERSYERILRARAAALGVEARVDWRGDRPREEVAEVLAREAIGLATFRPHPLRVHAAPLKLLEYMASGLPVVALDGSAAGDLVRATGAGALSPPTPEGIAAAVRGLVADPAAFRRMSEAGLRAAAEHDWGAILEREFRLLSAMGGAGAATTGPTG